MKKLLIGIGAAVILIVLVLVFVLLRKPATTTPQQNPVTFPGSGTTTTSTTNGTASFLQGADVKEDQANHGYFYLGNQPSSDQTVNPPYLIEYIAATHYFTISISQEPIGQYRREAERYLQQKLGATQDQMCSLNYTIGVPDWVNSQYSDMNLGFSFCPGAVQLPE